MDQCHNIVGIGLTYHQFQLTIWRAVIHKDHDSAFHQETGGPARPLGLELNAFQRLTAQADGETR